MINIKPRAANAFTIELLIYNGEKPTVVGRLECHSDGGKLHILCRDKRFTVFTRPTASKVFEEKELAVTGNLTIEMEAS